MPWTNQTTSAVLIDELDLNQSYRKTTNCVSLEGPKRIGYFSCYDNNNDIVFSQDISSLRYLDLPNPVSINCLQGYDSTRKYGHVNSSDMLLLRWVLENEITMQKFPSDFICKNGLMKDMMIVLYDDDNWSLSATKIGGKIVLNKMESIEKKENIDSQTEHVNQSTYATSLQRLITQNSNHSQCSSGIENDSFFGVFHTKIGSHRILHAGWLHCVESKQELDKPFVHMKFALIGKYNGPREFHSSHKANTWWSLATLAGVDTIIQAKCERDFIVKIL
uniref:Decapping nuclease n=1 Tax=Tetranychus urticae TaxID=32264 RepID=T1KUE9_TETUR